MCYLVRPANPWLWTGRSLDIPDTRERRILCCAQSVSDGQLVSASDIARQASGRGHVARTEDFKVFTLSCSQELSYV
jgi:hypothetical protein